MSLETALFPLDTVSVIGNSQNTHKPSTQNLQPCRNRSTNFLYPPDKVLFCKKRNKFAPLVTYIIIRIGSYRRVTEAKRGPTELNAEQDWTVSANKPYFCPSPKSLARIVSSLRRSARGTFNCCCVSVDDDHLHRPIHGPLRLKLCLPVFREKSSEGEREILRIFRA